MSMRLARLALLPCLLTACGGRPGEPESRFTMFSGTSNSNASMRGISVVDERIAWASGTAGTVLRTTDGGTTWRERDVPHADSLDFRDIAAFDSLTAYVLSAGEDGRIYKTVNGGRDWQLQFSNQTKDAFFDCFDFWDSRHGIAMSDPVDGKWLLVRTTDGENWQPVPRANLPRMQDGEAAFAASGTCVVAEGQRRVFLASGGGATTRVFVSNDRGDTWQAVSTPVAGGAGSAGIFSLAFKDASNGIAMGGDYQKPADDALVAITANGGKSWAPVGKTSYVSGAAWTKDGNIMIATGTKGTRISDNRGVTWTTIDTVEYNAVQIKGRAAYLVGPRGRIAKLVIR